MYGKVISTRIQKPKNGRFIPQTSGWFLYEESTSPHQVPLPPLRVMETNPDFVRPKRRVPRLRVNRCLTSHLSPDETFWRAGIVPYTVRQSVPVYFLAVDSRYHQMTDAGGGLKRGEDPVLGGIRELDEETLGIFNFHNQHALVRNNSIAVYSPEMLIMFQHVYVENPNDVCREFHLRHAGRNSENEYFLWITETDLRTLILKPEAHIPLPPDLGKITGLTEYPPIYPRVRNLLRHMFKQTRSLVQDSP